MNRGKGRKVNLGLYPDRWQAAFAYNTAAESLHAGRGSNNEIPASHQPNADQVRWITSRVRRRLGLETVPEPTVERSPSTEQLLLLLEVTVVGFWRSQVSATAADLSRELDRSARRLVEAAHLLFWSPTSGQLTPQEALAKVLAGRVDRAVRRSAVAREVLDDVGDDEFRVARWLVYPEDLPGGGGFQDTIGRLYLDPHESDSGRPDATSPAWAAILGVSPPFNSRRVREAYRRRSKTVHPDAGGEHAAFIRLQAAYEEAQRYCASRGL
jgi:hypothetical protein